ncbi:MAG: nitroreductase family protein [Polyangiaceae bacterium]
MNVLEAIGTRRSARDFGYPPVSSADVRVLLEAAVHAPSALNEQPWAFWLRDQAHHGA